AQIKNDAASNAIPKQEALSKLMIRFSDPWNYTTNTGEHLYMSNSAQVSMIRSLSKLSGEVNANDSVRHAQNLLRLAHVHELNLEYKAEIKVLEKARAILDKKVKEVPDRLELPHGGDMYLFNLDQLTRAYVRIKRYPKAIDSAQKTVAYCKSVSGQNSSSYIWSNNDLARTYYDAGKQDLALQTFQKALKSAETADNADELKKVIASEDHLISQLYHHYSRDRKMVNQVMDLIKACGIKHIHGERY
ncbi:MAG: tetratricopeptide repeat protein, partial [Candidatus Obscuribacterales bacterium]|nr:tetratricopeptide repeat protein [Candidatus Obscuribacterales bacterium]